MNSAPYCLRCQTLHTTESLACGRCGFVSTKSMRRTHWNLHPALRRIEWALKTSLLFGALAAPFLVTPILEHAGNSVRYSYIVIGIFAYGLWETFSLMTRNRSYFSPRDYWLSFFALLTLALLFMEEPWMASGSAAAIPLIWFAAEWGTR